MFAFAFFDHDGSVRDYTFADGTSSRGIDRPFSWLIVESFRIERGLLTRELHGDDRRRPVLTLSEAGYRIYDEIVPLALGRERKLLATLDAEERAQLERILDKLAKVGLPAMLE